MIFGAIEAGGTKFVLGVGDEYGNLIESIHISTETPEKTIQNIYDYFKDKDISALGLGCFGPLELNRNSIHYGSITKTPKEKWTDFNILQALEKHLKIPIGFDTDVNAAALGEVKFGAAQGLKNVVYITIGTGIGAGAIVEGNLLHGLLHPEMGHIHLAQRHDDHYQGKCIYHKTCFEGLAAGPAIEARWQTKGEHLDVDHAAWDLQAYYIAQALVNYILILSPERIILGGGVMQQKHLFPLIHEYTQTLLNGYIHHPEIITDKIKEYIVEPGLDTRSGIIGALVLAKNAYHLSLE